MNLRLLSLRVENFRCFEDLCIDFEATRNYTDELTKYQEQGGGLTVIVAKNGQGKTALLDAINIGWGTFVGKMPDTKGQGFKKTDIKTTANTAGQIIETGKPVVSLNVLIDEKKYSVTRSLTSSEKKQTTTVKDAKALTSLANQILNIANEVDAATNLPVIAYYGDNRIFADNVLTKGHLNAILSRNRKFGYADSTNPKSGYKEFLKWYSHLQRTIADAIIRQNEARKRQDESTALAAWSERAQIYYYNEVVSQAVRTALEISGWDSLSYSMIDDKIYVSKITTGIDVCDKVPIDSLSAGTKSVLGVVADLAYRCCTLNPHLRERAAMGTPGIVLIDEIELHLHPAWQQQIIPTLQKIFPKIQFIVTTHSPQVVSSVPRKCVRIIDNGEVVPFSTPTQGVDIGDILAGIFGADPIPQNSEISQKLNKLHSMLTEGLGDSTEWNALYHELETYYGENYPPLLGTKAHREFLKKMKLGGNNA